MMDKSFGNHASILGERAGLKMKKRIIPVIVALALILIVALVGFGGMILDKYTYSKELADLDQYFGVGPGAGHRPAGRDGGGEGAASGGRGIF